MSFCLPIYEVLAERDPADVGEEGCCFLPASTGRHQSKWLRSNMPKRKTRFADIYEVFRGGDSPLMNDIGAISILYEDFRYELWNLRRAIEAARVGTDQEAYYWIRRSLLTMNEFGKRLTSVLGEKDRDEIGCLRKDKREALTAARRAIAKSS